MPMLCLCIPECCSIPIVSVGADELFLYKRLFSYLKLFIFELQSLKKEALQLFIV